VRLSRDVSRVAFVVAVLLTGCTTDEEAAPRQPVPTVTVLGSPTLPSPSETPSPSAEASVCGRMERVVSDPRYRRDEIQADVDGDGGEDVVAIYVDDPGEESCRAFLAVDESDITPVPIWESASLGGPLEPTFNGAFDVDGDGDAEIVVNEAAGASTQFVGLFDVVDKALTRIPAPISPGASAGFGLFATGGSVGHIEAVDCLAPGQIVVSIATPARERKAQKEGEYDLHRTLVSLSSGRVFDGGTEQQTLPIEDVLALPEFSGAPFGSCSSA
jgi:hypothetical protein